jgi:hypothetical protein
LSLTFGELHVEVARFLNENWIKGCVAKMFLRWLFACFALSL